MQEAKIIDKDGIAREYAFDSYDGVLYLKDSRQVGRQYRPIYKSKKPDQFGLAGTHAEMWDDVSVAQQALLTEPSPASWRSAY